MTNASPIAATASRNAERQLIRVCAPSAHAGIGDALRRAFVAPPLSNTDREFLQLLERC